MLWEYHETGGGACGGSGAGSVTIGRSAVFVSVEWGARQHNRGRGDRSMLMEDQIQIVASVRGQHPST